MRTVEAIPVQDQGQQLFVLRDPEQHAGQQLTVSFPALVAIQLMDGNSDRRDIQAAFFRQFGEILPTGELDALIEQLDQILLLDSERFREHRRALQEAYRKSAVREAVCAGSAYPQDPGELRAYLRGFFETDGEPGMPGRPEGPRDLVGLIVPHIDTGRGGAGYAAGYRELAERADAETFLLLGTNHQPSDSMYVATDKAFATPLGRTETDAELLKAIDVLYPHDLFADEMAHRTEHSLEFQALFLQFLLGGERPHRIVPILCNSPLWATGGAGPPEGDERIASFARAVRGAVAKTGRRVVFIAGADLAHVGPQFGDEPPVDGDLLERCETYDRGLMERALAGDAAGFYDRIKDEGDRYRICGLGPIDAMLRCLDFDRGKLLHYGQWADKSGNGSVTFASAGFYRGGRAMP